MLCLIILISGALHSEDDSRNCWCRDPQFFPNIRSGILMLVFCHPNITKLLCFIGTQLSTGAAIETYRRGHRKWPARPSKPTGAAIENDRRGHRNLPARPSKMTGAAIETIVYIGHRKWPARPSKPTGAAAPVILDGRAGSCDGRPGSCDCHTSVSLWSTVQNISCYPAGYCLHARYMLHGHERSIKTSCLKTWRQSIPVIK